MLNKVRTSQAAARVLPAVVAAIIANPAVATAHAEHSVRYVVTAGGGGEVEIHYRTEPPSENSSGAQYEHVWVSPTEPWEQNVSLDEPNRYAYISVRQVWWNPALHCEVWVDGVLVKQNSKGVCI
ncbi:hypothetical protein BKG69_13165 [Mycobacteroides chelonae]|nr:hypothetical protein BKG69_13165 [Mycobacteroides chelonae]